MKGYLLLDLIGFALCLAALALCWRSLQRVPAPALSRSPDADPDYDGVRESLKVSRVSRRFQ